MAQPLPTTLIYMSDDIRLSLKPGMIVRVHQKVREKDAKGNDKERIQIFEGTVLYVKHGKEAGATFTVRKVSESIGVERIFPIHSPVVEKIEFVRQLEVHRAKASHLRTIKRRLQEVKEEPFDSASFATAQDKQGKEEKAAE